MYLSVLLHEIARWAVPFLRLPPGVKRRAEAGLLTPADCRLIAEQLRALGRELATHDDVEEASRLGEETAQLIRLAQEDEEFRDYLQDIHKLSDSQPRQAYLRYFLSRSSRNRGSH